MPEIMRPLRIAVLGTRGFPDVQGGVERHCEELYCRLAALGCNIMVYARRGYVPNKPYEFQGVSIIPLWTLKKKSLEAIIHTLYGLFRILLHKSKLDIIHIHAIGPSLVVPLARLFGLKVIITNHGPDYERKKWGRAAKLFLRAGERLGTRFASAVIAVSKQVKSVLESKYGRTVTYIPNGVVVHQPVPAGVIREKYALEPGKYLLAVGRLVPEKGFHDLLEAYAGIESNWRLIIAGGADHEDKYSNMLSKQAAQDLRVVMTGFVTGKLLAELYSNASFLVLPSYHEGLPITILEAMSYGLPVLASSIPANRELVADKNELFEPGDVVALRKKIGEFMQINSRQRINMHYRERVRTEFNWEAIAQTTLDLYRTVSERR